MKTKWYHFICLILLLQIALFVRLHEISKFGIWEDEYWALYLATGRGDALFEIPHQVILTDPPAIGFANAPSWPHIWTGLDSVTHPPVFYFLLRWWVDLFGESDVSIRILPLVFGMAGILLLYDCVRLVAGPWWGLMAAGMMVFAPPQIDFSQQVRPYTLIAFEGLVIADILLRTRPWSNLKLLFLGSTVFAIALTHYFALGIIAGTAAYAFATFKGTQRLKVLATIIFSMLIALAIWLPMGLRNKDIGLGDRPSLTIAQEALPIITVPQRMLLGQNSEVKWTVIGFAVLVYVLPVFDRRKWLWWLWVSSTVCLIFLVDLHRRSCLLQFDRYALLAAPGVYAILAMPVKFGSLNRAGKVIPMVSLFGAIVFSIAHYQQGPDFTIDSTYQLENHRDQCAFLKHNIHSGDLLVLAGLSSFSPFSYFIVSHYNGRPDYPVMLLSSPIDPELKRQMLTFKHIWMMGSNPAEDTKALLPGWSPSDIHGSTYFDDVWQVNCRG